MLQHPTYWATLRSELLTSQGCTRCGGPGVFTYTRRLDSIDSRLYQSCGPSAPLGAPQRTRSHRLPRQERSCKART